MIMPPIDDLLSRNTNLEEKLQQMLIQSDDCIDLNVKVCSINANDHIVIRDNDSSSSPLDSNIITNYLNLITKLRENCNEQDEDKINLFCVKEKRAAENVIEEELKTYPKLTKSWGCVDRNGVAHFFETNAEAIEYSSNEQTKEYKAYGNPLFSCFVLPLSAKVSDNRSDSFIDVFGGSINGQQCLRSQDIERIMNPIVLLL